MASDSVFFPQVEHHARKGDVIVLAGAGVSAVDPSALPGWKPLNKAIIEALTARLESALSWLASRLGEFNRHAMAMLDAGNFPPEYQAQLIEEVCGDRYFRALQSLDVDVMNACHEGISALASGGALKAIVTTNFDRLIEQALDRRGVKYEVAYDDVGFGSLCKRLQRGTGGPLPVIKIHGCVSTHLSMIDTLKQRQRGRTRHLQDCLDSLKQGYWVYLGFSAADLETVPDYLGLADRAKRSAGGTFVTRPANPELGKGAKLLMSAHGERGIVERSEIAAYLVKVCNVIKVPGPATLTTEEQLGFARFKQRLQQWAECLSTSAAGLCLAAIYEAVGNAEGAVRLLDRLVRHELHDERNTADFRALQLHYGRLGAVWGRFVGVRDINGAAANASVETIQSLLRIVRSDLGFAASAWLSSLYLWLNMGSEALKLADSLMCGLIVGKWEGIAPRNDEEVADAWISAAQVYVMDEGEHLPKLLEGSLKPALERARAAGDVVRSARIAALYLLGLWRTSEDVPAFAEGYRSEFEQAERVGDGFALGMRSLALGRWYVGPAGLALAARSSGNTIALQAIEHLQTAVSFLHRQGMDPWVLYARVQIAKALGDLHRFDQARDFFEEMTPGFERFPILCAHAHEAVWQLLRMEGRADSVQSLKIAIDAAESSGLSGKHDMLMAQLAALQ